MPPDGDPRLNGLETSWRLRRRAVWLTLSFCMTGLAYLTLAGRHDSHLHETIATSLAMLLGSVVMAYIAGAAYDDRSRRQTWASYETTRMQVTARRKADLDDAAG